jgi:hypothetical protein
MNQPRGNGVREWILPLALLAALGCNSRGSAIGPAGPGNGSGNGAGNGSGTGAGVGWWTMPTAGPGGTIGGTPGSGSGSGPGSGPGTGVGGPGSTAGGGSVTVPGTTGAPMTPHLPGGGVAGNTQLAPGCTPASAVECPTINGACATGAGATVTVTKFGTLCLSGEMSTFSQPVSTIEYIMETVNGQSYYRFRVTFNPHFVDNTYGTSSIGWPPNRGHRWMDLVKSDHTELMLFNAAGMMTLHFKMDYISENAARMCGFGTLGVKGGDGSMIVGNPAWILNVGTSLDRNLNGCGYCMSPACPGGDCRVNSPTTDMNYTTNPQAPNWDFRLVYDVWIDPAAFGSSGFGKANISYVHASPAKGGSDTIIVSSKPCPPNWDNPYVPPGGAGGSVGGGGTGTGGSGGGGTGSGVTCPINWTEYVTSEGKSICVPNPIPTSGTGSGSGGGTGGSSGGGGTGSGYTCPVDWMLFITSEGKATCVPSPTPTGGTGAGGGAIPVGPGNSCPVNYELYVSSEGKATCLPTGTGIGGPAGSPMGGTAGGTGVIPGAGGSCPTNYQLYKSADGHAICLPGSSTGTGSGTGGPVPVGPGNSCPINYEVYLTSEGKATCLPVGTGTGGKGSGSGGGGTAGGAGILPGAGNSCPINYELYVSTEGRAICLPSGMSGGGRVPIGPGGTCPAGYSPVIPMEGPPSECAPNGSTGGGTGGGTGGTGGGTGGTGGGSGSGSGGGAGAGTGLSCPIDWTLYVTTEGKAVCTPTPRAGNSCPINWTSYTTSEGKVTCVPVPRNGVCPEGYKYDVTSEGRYCI